jgi:hypothetical protein
MVVNATHFQQYFSYIVAVSFIGGGSTRRKPLICRKSLTFGVPVSKYEYGPQSLLLYFLTYRIILFFNVNRRNKQKPLNHVCLRTKIYENRNKMLTQISNLWLVYFNFYYYDEIFLSLYMTSRVFINRD